MQKDGLAVGLASLGVVDVGQFHFGIS